MVRNKSFSGALAMLSQKNLLLAAAFSVCFSFSASAADNNTPAATGYAPGSNELVKSWASLPDYSGVKGSNHPLFVYVYTGLRNDKVIPKNPQAQFLEGSDFLNNADVKEKLKNFTCARLDINILSKPKEAPKGWPPDLLGLFRGLRIGVMIFNSDITTPISIGANPLPTANYLKTACDKVMEYEAKKQMNAPAIKPEQKKPEEPKPAAPAENKVNFGGPAATDAKPATAPASTSTAPASTPTATKKPSASDSE
jgi:hypothetical protein